MNGRSLRTPSYRHHKASGQAAVTLSGADHYLGKHGSPESRAAYDRLVSEWLARGRRPGESPRGDKTAEPPYPTVSELLAAFTRHASAYYVRDGKPTTEARNIRLSLGPVRKLFGAARIDAFGPKALKTVRDSMVESGLCRNEVNKRIRRVIMAFRWGVAEEFVPPAVHQALKAVPGLRAGRTTAPESSPVKPVDDAHVEAIRPFVARQVWAMIEVQRLSGARPGEVASMTSGAIDRSGEVWVYTPRRHKTTHIGKERAIYLGPKAQAVLSPWLRDDPDAPLFQPKEAEAERYSSLRKRRKSPVQPSQRSRRLKRPRRMPGEAYTTDTYAKAIARACEKAGVPVWGPHRLRHSRATQLRREFGIETTRIILGHSDAQTTLIYAEEDRARAVEAMGRVG